MKRWSFPLWLLRDVPALLGLLASFWTLIIFAMTSARKAASADKATNSVRERFAMLLALAEARLDYAFWRQAYRRIGWHPRAVTLEIFPPNTLWSDTQTRLLNFAHAFRNMNHVVDAYVGHIRDRFGISKSDLVAHGSTDARQSRAALHELVGVAPFISSTALVALTLSSARRARPWKDERGYTHARGPPLHTRQRTTQSSPPRKHPLPGPHPHAPTSTLASQASACRY